MLSKLEEDITSLLNRENQEAASNTPDFVLARFLLFCLDAFNRGVIERDRWYGQKPEPGMKPKPSAEGGIDA